MKASSHPAAYSADPAAASTRAPAPNLRAMSRKGILAIFDQGLISGSNFVISIVLARTLLPGDYGVYALAFEVFLLLSVAYTSLVLEPMSVFGASIYREHHRQYFGTLLRVHAAASAAIVALLAATAWAVHIVNPAGSLAGALAGVGIAGPLVLLFWVTRRAFYMRLLPRGAVVGGGVYFITLMAGLFFLYSSKLLSPFFVFLLMGLGGALASLAMLRLLKPDFKTASADPRPREVLRRHWDYGRWALASAVPGWFFSGALYYPLLGHFSGLAQAGELKALLNLNSPITQAFVAVSLLSLPYASQTYHRDGSRSVPRLVWRLTLLYLGGTALYWVILLALRAPVIHALYGGKYAVIAGLLPWIALGSILRITASAEANVLRAMQSPASVCRVYSIVGALAVAAGVPLIWLFGIEGAVYTFVISGAAACLVGLATVLRKASILERSGTQKIEELSPSRSL